MKNSLTHLPGALLWWAKTVSLASVLWSCAQGHAKDSDSRVAPPMSYAAEIDEAFRKTANLEFHGRNSPYVEFKGTRIDKPDISRLQDWLGNLDVGFYGKPLDPERLPIGSAESFILILNGQKQTHKIIITPFLIQVSNGSVWRVKTGSEFLSDEFLATIGIKPGEVELADAYKPDAK